jgi:hypothetical protein
MQKQAITNMLALPINKMYCDRTRSDRIGSLLGFYSVNVLVSNCRQFSSCRRRGLSFHCLLVAVSWKVCCLCVM